jgi:hypothetical protein
MARIQVLVALVATFIITTIGACAYYQLSIGNANPKNAIMSEALRVCLKDLGSLRYSTLTQGGTIIVLSNDQIEDTSLPRSMGSLKIVVLNQATIDAKAAAEGPFLYLVFNEVNVYEDTAYVSFHVTGIFDSGSGGSINLTLQDGIWVGEGGFWWIA